MASHSNDTGPGDPVEHTVSENTLLSPYTPRREANADEPVLPVRRSMSAPDPREMFAAATGKDPHRQSLLRKVTLGPWMRSRASQMSPQTTAAGADQLGPEQQLRGRSSTVAASADDANVNRTSTWMGLLLDSPPQQTDPDHPIIRDALGVIDPRIQTQNSIDSFVNEFFWPGMPTKPLFGRNSWSTRPASENLVQSASTKKTRPAPIPERPDEDDDADSDSEDAKYFILPPGVSLQNWTEEEKSQLDDYVRHMLRSKRSITKQRAQAFWDYFRTPFGFVATIYFFLIFVFGFAWVLFLIGWIYVGDEQLYMIEVIDQVLVALFCVVGIGFIPFRIRDTYRMIAIVHYARLTWKMRRKSGLPPLKDCNDLPTLHPEDLEAVGRTHSNEEAEDSTVLLAPDSRILVRRPTQKLTENEKRLSAGGETPLEQGKALIRKALHHARRSTDMARKSTEASRKSLNVSRPSTLTPEFTRPAGTPAEYSVLTLKQQRRLEHHQECFQRAHAYYRPHEVYTHRAFSIRFLFVIVVLLDFHSLFQLSLGLTTWIVHYKVRPVAATTTLLCLSLSVNIGAGILINVASRRSGKKNAILLQKKRDLTWTAMKQLEKKNGGHESRGDTSSAESDREGRAAPAAHHQTEPPAGEDGQMLEALLADDPGSSRTAVTA